MTLRQLLNGLRLYVREFSGEAAYDRYCERHRRHHPHAPVPTRREYEHMRTRHREANPSSRCC
ncbi:YbdD/YjiX family protein [Streptomyces sp. NBC_00210]|uniref:YbdD/YjiX family protein n=1 Tax=Streptomyces sp. NBC_00210 TaxID=2903636 RepID=UPI00324C737E